jgi:hypothetical protein
MPVNASVIGVEVVGIPLKRCIAGALGVGGAVIHLHGQDVFFVAEVYGAGDIQAVCRHAVLVEPGEFAVEENLAGLPHAFEFEKNFVAGKSGGELEMLAVPGQPFVGAAVAAAMGNDLAK